jgi:hypothetical protein
MKAKYKCHNCDKIFKENEIAYRLSVYKYINCESKYGQQVEYKLYCQYCYDLRVEV